MVNRSLREEVALFDGTSPKMVAGRLRWTLESHEVLLLEQGQSPLAMAQLNVATESQ